MSCFLSPVEDNVILFSKNAEKEREEETERFVILTRDWWQGGGCVCPHTLRTVTDWLVARLGQAEKYTKHTGFLMMHPSHWFPNDASFTLVS